MSDRILDLAGDDRHLALDRGFLVIRQSRPVFEELGRVAVDDLTTVIVSGHGLTFSANLVNALAERWVVVFADAKHRPAALLTPLVGQHLLMGLCGRLAANLPSS